MKLAMATGRPESVVGIHFFNPVPVLRLVELVASLLTSEATAERARSFAAGQLGKTVIHSRGSGRVRRERASDPLPALGDQDARVRVRHRRGHRQRDG
jgi:hypothetical protein